MTERRREKDDGKNGERLVKKEIQPQKAVFKFFNRNLHSLFPGRFLHSE